MCYVDRGYGRQTLSQRLNGVALLLLILPKFVFEMGPRRFLFEGAGAVCLIVAIWMVFKDRRRV